MTIQTEHSGVHACDTALQSSEIHKVKQQGRERWQTEVATANDAFKIFSTSEDPSSPVLPWTNRFRDPLCL